jgi:hypothetical protein
MDRRLQEHSLGLVYLSTLLEEAKSEIGSDGDINGTIRKKILLMFCSLDPLFALHCNSGAPETKAKDQPRESDADKETETDPALTFGAMTISSRHMRWSARNCHWTQRPEASACRPRMQPTSSSATRLTLTTSSIALWTNWKVCNDSVKVKTYHRLSTLTSVGRDRPFCETKLRSPLNSVRAG